MTTPPVLLLVCQGTPDDDGAEAFRSLVAEPGGRDPELPVAGGLGTESPPPLIGSGEARAELVGERYRETLNQVAEPRCASCGGRGAGAR